MGHIEHMNKQTIQRTLRIPTDLYAQVQELAGQDPESDVSKVLIRAIRFGLSSPALSGKLIFAPGSGVAQNQEHQLALKGQPAI